MDSNALNKSPVLTPSTVNEMVFSKINAKKFGRWENEDMGEAWGKARAPDLGLRAGDD
jgi:hypothetical protein